VLISDCHLHVTDDAICLKNVRTDYIVRNVVVTNCIIRTICNGIKIGTDTWGGFEDLTFSNIVIANPEGDICDAAAGININCVDGGSVRRINVSNVVMKNVRCPFYLLIGKRTRYQSTVRTPQVGVMEDISISHVQAFNTRYTSYLVGHPESTIRNVRLDDITLRRGREFLGRIPDGPVPEKPEAYPHPWTFDELPAHGLYTRHVESFEATRLRLITEQPDARPAMLQEESLS
jgi:polygalacturonase